jgi:hypothetical protein
MFLGYKYILSPCKNKNGDITKLGIFNKNLNHYGNTQKLLILIGMIPMLRLEPPLYFLLLLQ